MRPQLLRAAAPSFRVAAANSRRAFATTVPRPAEVELTVGKWMDWIDGFPRDVTNANLIAFPDGKKVSIEGICCFEKAL